MKILYVFLVAFLGLPVSSLASISFVDLQTAGSFGILAGSTVTNTGLTLIVGELGVWPGSAVTGFPPGIVSNGTIHLSDAVAQQAQADLVTAYNFAAGLNCQTNLTGQDLGGLTLTPGSYCFDSTAQLTGLLTLNGLGDPNAVFVFQIGSTLTTASASQVLLSNGVTGFNIFWQVGSSATLGTTTAFQGNIMALASITLNTGATIGCGSALARTGAVTLDTNVVSVCDATSETPEPATAALACATLPPLLWMASRRSRVGRPSLRFWS